ncbi:hypothetical protein BCD67_23885 [Oscillatoriales cyanobacterium USR001]|nr:hypothetical protein BCD67_23885 [Oscillatoriales cyanobacterium USR001]
MIFEWSEYLNLAKELAGKVTTSANQEAKLRAAISICYYAAFIKARNYLRDNEGIDIPDTGEAHQYVREQFAISSERNRQKIADNLRYLLSYRRKVDYDDFVPGLSGITPIAIRLSEQVISDLNNL